MSMIYTLRCRDQPPWTCVSVYKVSKQKWTVSEVHSHSEMLELRVLGVTCFVYVFFSFYRWVYIVVCPLFHLFTHWIFNTDCVKPCSMTILRIAPVLGTLLQTEDNTDLPLVGLHRHFFPLCSKPWGKRWLVPGWEPAVCDGDANTQQCLQNRVNTNPTFILKFALLLYFFLMEKEDTDKEEESLLNYGVFLFIN